MLVGMATGLNQEISVQDIGLTGLTHADGLAVGRPSGFVGRVMKNLLGGEFTIRDGKLYDYMRDLLGTENIFLEPSACASFEGPIQIERNESARKYLQENHLEEKMKMRHILHGQQAEVLCRKQFVKNTKHVSGEIKRTG